MTITVHEAKTHLSRYLAEVENGLEILIARGKKPVARLVPLMGAMNWLLDTCVFLWLALEPTRLSKRAAAFQRSALCVFRECPRAIDFPPCSL